MLLLLLLWGVDHDFTKNAKGAIFFYFFLRCCLASHSTIIFSPPPHVGGMGLQDLMDLSQSHMQILLMNLFFFVSSLRRRIITCGSSGSTSLFLIYDELALKEC